MAHVPREGGVRHKVKDERRKGFKPTNSAEVVFERQVDGGWKAIRGSRTLTDPASRPPS